MSPAVTVHHVVDSPGGAPTLILSNSLGTALEMWDPQLPELARGFRVVRYDMRGHGRSPVPPGPYDISDLGADLMGLMDAIGSPRVHLAGLSLGGLVSLWVAANAPDRVASLTVLSIAPRPPDPDVYRRRAALVRAKGTAEIADLVVSRWLTPDFIAANPQEADRLAAMIRATPAEGYAACCEVVAETDVTPILGRIQAPTTCVAAADDPAMPVAGVRAMAAAIPRGRFELVEHAAHLQNVEQPERVSALIVAQAREVAPEIVT